MNTGERSGAPPRSPSLAALLAATRPGFLGLALVAVLLGLASAIHDGFPITAWTAALSLLGAVLAHGGANALNDYYDHLNGCDAGNVQRIPPFTGGGRTIQEGRTTPAQVAAIGWTLFGATAVIGGILLVATGPGLLLFGLAGLLLGWLYSAPPLFLAGRGWGEVTVAAAFGLLIPTGAAYVQSGELHSLALAAGAPLAVLTAAILYINQFPDYAADRLTGKRHWVVRLGPRLAWPGYPLLVAGAAGALILGVVAGPLPGWALASLLPMGLHAVAVPTLARHFDEPVHLRPALANTVTGTLCYAVTTALVLLLTA